MTPRSSIAFVLLAVALSANTAHADVTTAEARATQLFEQGRALAKDGKCNEAIPLFLESVKEVAGVGPLLNLGLCYEQTGKPATAYRYFVRAEEVARAHNDPRSAEARQRAAALEPKLPHLTVRVPSNSEPDLALALDGEPLATDNWNVALRVDPGTHVVEARSSQRAPATLRVNVRGDGDAQELAVPAIAPVETPPPAEEKHSGSTQRFLGWTLAGVGAGALVAGGVFGALSASDHGSLKDKCPAYPTCNASQRAELDDLNDSARTKGTIATAAVIPGAVLLVAGVVLVLTAR